MQTFLQNRGQKPETGLGGLGSVDPFIVLFVKF